MIDGKKIIAVIPARSGSKRIPNKNVLLIAGKPLIKWTIDAALKSKYVDYTLVTTDLENIRRISTSFGANAPFLRPSELATDKAESASTVIHSLEELEKRALNFDFVLLLQPTSPLRNSKHIDEAIELFVKRDADAVISVCKAEHSPQWINHISSDGNMADFVNAVRKKMHSQDLSSYYRLNGAIYLIKVEDLKCYGTFFIDGKVFSYIMPNACSIDIDEQLDFEIAEILLKKLA